jgi:hypothetical protein
MATDTKYTAAVNVGDQEMARRCWELLFKPADKLTAAEYADLYQICGETWRVHVFEKNKKKAA